MSNSSSGSRNEPPKKVFAMPVEKKSSVDMKAKAKQVIKRGKRGG